MSRHGDHDLQEEERHVKARRPRPTVGLSFYGTIPKFSNSHLRTLLWMYSRTDDKADSFRITWSWKDTSHNFLLNRCQPFSLTPCIYRCVVKDLNLSMSVINDRDSADTTSWIEANDFSAVFVADSGLMMRIPCMWSGITWNTSNSICG